MSNVCIVAINEAFANAGTLQKTLKCNIAVEHTESKGFGKLCTKTPFSLDDIPEAEHYIFAGSGVLLKIDVDKLKGRKSVIISDSYYLTHTKEIDEIIERNNIEVHCMLDLWKFCKFPKKAYFQPFDKLKIEVRKDRFPTASHSPFSQSKCIVKGTDEIKKAIEYVKEIHPIDFTVILDETWKRSLEIKSQSHFFIDQLSNGKHNATIEYQGGIGKSGLEAMLLKCLTFSSGEAFDTDIPRPPYIGVCDTNELHDKLVYFIKHPIELEQTIQKQYAWAKKYTNPKYVTEKILN